MGEDSVFKLDGFIVKESNMNDITLTNYVQGDMKV